MSSGIDLNSEIGNGTVVGVGLLCSAAVEVLMFGLGILCMEVVLLPQLDCCM